MYHCKKYMYHNETLHMYFSCFIDLINRRVIMIKILLMLFMQANANFCTPVLSVKDTAKAMQKEIEMLQILASKLSDKALMSEIEHERQGREEFALVNFLGIPLIPMSLEFISRQGNEVNDTHKPFIELWQKDIWSYVLLFEYRKRIKNR